MVQFEDPVFSLFSYFFSFSWNFSFNKLIDVLFHFFFIQLGHCEHHFFKASTLYYHVGWTFSLSHFSSSLEQCKHLFFFWSQVFFCHIGRTFTFSSFSSSLEHCEYPFFLVATLLLSHWVDVFSQFFFIQLHFTLTCHVVDLSLTSLSLPFISTCHLSVKLS